MRSHRRRGPLDHVLVAGDIADLDAIWALLALMPETTYGQVYVEAPARVDVPALPVPPRMTVHVVPSPTGALGSGAAVPGARLAEVVDAWAAEWLPGEPDPDRAVSMWVSAAARTHLSAAAVGALAPVETL